MVMHKRKGNAMESYKNTLENIADGTENNEIIDALCREYHSIFILRYNTGTFSVMHMPEKFEYIVKKHTIYNEGKDEYCELLVSDNDRERMKYLADIDNVAEKLKYQKIYELTFQTVDHQWMAARYMEIAGESGRTFLLGIIKYDRDMQEQQRTKHANQIITSLSEAYQAIYRCNIVTGDFEIILLKFEDNDFVHNSSNLFELEDYYNEHKVEQRFRGRLARNTGQSSIIEHFNNGSQPIIEYYKENDGNWMCLKIIPEGNFSESYPYVIYAIRQSNDEVKNRTESIINKSAISKMYVLAMCIDVPGDTYDCIHSDKKESFPNGNGRLSDFMDFMKGLVYEEDYDKFQSLIYDVTPDTKGFLEREYRAEDEQGMVYFLNAFSTYIRVPEGSRVLLLVRNIDERAANRARINSLNQEYDMTKNMLYALGDAYYAIYYCNFVKNRIVPSRQSNDLKKIFSMKQEYIRFVKDYCEDKVFPDDRDKVGQFMSVDYIKSQLYAEGQSIFCEYMRLFGTEYRWVRMDIQAIRCAEGVVSEAVYAFKDIHNEREEDLRHKKELRDALIEAEQASAAKSEFLSNMSHDIRTPMNAVLGMTDIALNHIDEKERVVSCLRKIDTAGKHLLKLINEVLDMSYIERGRIVLNEDKFSLPDMLHGIVLINQEAVKAKGLTMICRAINVVNENIIADRVRINQILINTMGNAIKYTPDGGTIWASIEQAEDVQTGIGTYVFRIKDNGIGMSEEFVQKIFQPFEREQDVTVSQIEGTGLGMAITKKLVDMMHGTIEVESEPGKGSEFIITLPIKYIDCIRTGNAENYEDKYTVVYYENSNTDIVNEIKKAAAAGGGKPVIVAGSYDISDIESEAAAAGMKAFLTEPIFCSDYEKMLYNTVPAEDSKQPEKYDFTGRRILVVDDNEINADIACDFLNDVGAACDTAGNGQEAYDIINGPVKYDVVLMDVRMPVLNGYEATKKIRDIGSEYAIRLPIIAMTANVFAEDVYMSRKSGMNDHISKPVNPEIMYSVINRCLSHISEM